MATAMSTRDIDECEICRELLKTPRVLPCRHVFCLSCLETLERNKTIKCPKCRKMTDIAPGLQVKHLPRNLAFSHRARGDRPRINLVKKIKVRHQISSVLVDDYAQAIYTGTADSKEPVKIYSYNGDELGKLKPKINHPSLALDTKRGLVLVTGGPHFMTFDREGEEVGTIHYPQFQDLEDAVYQPCNDLYVVGDVKTHRLFYVDPKTHKVVRSVKAEEARLGPGGGRNLFMAASKTTSNTTLATLDLERNIVKLYDGDGKFINSYGGKGVGYGQFDWPHGVSVDRQGRVVVSDMYNQRLVRLSPDAVERHREWQVIGGTQQFGLGHPRLIDITEDGLAVVAFFTSPKNGPYNLAVLDGFD